MRASQITVGSAGRPRLDAIDLALETGDRLALLGVNGAGKSTLMQVLAGVLLPDRGAVTVDGKPLARHRELRRRIGFLPQRVPVYPDLTVEENLAWAGRLRGLRGQALTEAMRHTLDMLDMASLARRLVARLSTGMRQRLGLGQAVLHAPDLLILDEPTAGLDPLQTEQIRALLGGLSQQRSLILATHLLDDVQPLCNRVIVLDRGTKASEQPVGPNMDLLGTLRSGIAPGPAAAS